MGKDEFVAKLEATSTDTKRRPVCVSSVDSAAPHPSNEAGFKDKFLKAAEIMREHLRFVPNRMRMRVHFGPLCLKEWRKDVAQYDYKELDNLLTTAGRRGTSNLEQR
jgi:hypothetical protein